MAAHRRPVEPRRRYPSPSFCRRRAAHPRHLTNEYRAFQSFLSMMTQMNRLSVFDLSFDSFFRVPDKARLVDLWQTTFPQTQLGVQTVIHSFSGRGDDPRAMDAPAPQTDPAVGRSVVRCAPGAKNPDALRGGLCSASPANKGCRARRTVICINIARRWAQHARWGVAAGYTSACITARVPEIVRRTRDPPSAAQHVQRCQ